MKISGRVVSTKPISLSRAAKLISRFAAVENGSSPAVSLYLQRTSDAFNRLLQSNDKRSKTKNIRDSENVARESEKEIIDDVKSDGDAVEAPAKEKKKKKKKRKSGEAAENSGSKKNRA